MRTLRNAGVCVPFALVVLMVFTRPAYGYIDPGTGSFVIQVLIGSALGCLLAIKIFWRKIVGALGRLFGRKPAGTAGAAAPEVQGEAPGLEDGSQSP